MYVTSSFRRPRKLRQPYERAQLSPLQKVMADMDNFSPKTFKLNSMTYYVNGATVKFTTKQIEPALSTLAQLIVNAIHARKYYKAGRYLTILNCLASHDSRLDGLQSMLNTYLQGGNWTMIVATLRNAVLKERVEDSTKDDLIQLIETICWIMIFATKQGHRYLAGTLTSFILEFHECDKRLTRMAPTLRGHASNEDWERFSNYLLHGVLFIPK